MKVSEIDDTALDSELQRLTVENASNLLTVDRIFIDRKWKVSSGYYVSIYKLEYESSRFATWASNKETPDDTYWGHYFDNIVDAAKDYDER